MKRALAFVIIALYAGCFDLRDKDCSDHAYQGQGGCGSRSCDCPLSASLARENGASCEGSKVDACGDEGAVCICDDDTRRWRCSAPDFAEPERVLDLAVPVPDFTIVANCTQYRDCLGACYATLPNANVATCTQRCAPDTDPQSVARYAAAISCGTSHCLGDVDAGTGACLLGSDGTTLLNADGTPTSPSDTGTGQKRCNLCLSDATAALVQVACTETSSADCNPAECAASVDACLHD